MIIELRRRTLLRSTTCSDACATAFRRILRLPNSPDYAGPCRPAGVRRHLRPADQPLAIKGFEVMRALRKGQASAFNITHDIRGEARIVECASALAEAVQSLDERIQLEAA